MNVFHKTFLEKVRQLEKERNETMANPEFQDWMRTFKVSQLHEDRSVKINAYDLQMQYDTKRYSKLNFSI